MTDTNKLKELAERATPGRNFDRLPSAGGGLKYTCTGDDDSLVLRVDHKNGEFGFIGPKGEEDEAFFLACTPKAVLELIAEVERLHRVAESAWSKADEFGNKMFWQNWDQAKHGGFDNVLTERDRLKVENEALRSALQAFVLRADAYLEAGRDMPDASMKVVLEKARAALEGGRR